MIDDNQKKKKSQNQSGKLPSKSCTLQLDETFDAMVEVKKVN